MNKDFRKRQMKNAQKLNTRTQEKKIGICFSSFTVTVLPTFSRVIFFRLHFLHLDWHR